MRTKVCIEIHCEVICGLSASTTFGNLHYWCSTLSLSRMAPITVFFPSYLTRIWLWMAIISIWPTSLNLYSVQPYFQHLVQSQLKFAKFSSIGVVIGCYHRVTLGKIFSWVNFLRSLHWVWVLPGDVMGTLPVSGLTWVARFNCSDTACEQICAN